MLRLNLAVVLTVLAAAPSSALADAGPTDIAVIGNTAFGAGGTDPAAGLVQRINDDPATSLVMHVGGIKPPAAPCDDLTIARTAPHSTPCRTPSSTRQAPRTGRSATSQRAAATSRRGRS